jgi:uncharacterized protein
MIEGLNTEQHEMILKEISAITEIERAVVFGSRAMGNHKKGSDVDIAIFGIDASTKIAIKLAVRLNEYTTMPYKFDVLSFNSITEPNLRRHITENGRTIFKRDK